MIFIGAQSCDYQSFGQIYVRQVGESCISANSVSKVSVRAQFMDGVIIAQILISPGKLLRMVIVAG